MNTLVTFPIAKLLKEKEFNEECRWYYDTEFKEYTSHREYENFRNSEIENGYGKLKYPMISAPTISDVVMWLYEKHGIWIWVSMELGYEITFCWNLTGEYVSSNYKPYFKSPTEAYLDAIKYTLNNLI